MNDYKRKIREMINRDVLHETGRITRMDAPTRIGRFNKQIFELTTQIGKQKDFVLITNRTWKLDGFSIGRKVTISYKYSQMQSGAENAKYNLVHMVTPILETNT